RSPGESATCRTASPASVGCGFSTLAVKSTSSPGSASVFEAPRVVKRSGGGGTLRVVYGYSASADASATATAATEAAAANTAPRDRACRTRGSPGRPSTTAAAAASATTAAA